MYNIFVIACGPAPLFANRPSQPRASADQLDAEVGCVGDGVDSEFLRRSCAAVPHNKANLNQYSRCSHWVASSAALMLSWVNQSNTLPMSIASPLSVADDVTPKLSRC